jgi:hypothetical protein
MTLVIRPILVFAAFSCSWLPTSTALAHFLWLATDSQGRAIYFFGESVADQTYQLPEQLAAGEVYRHDAEGKRLSPLELLPVDSVSLIGRRSANAVTTRGGLTAQQTYGLYHGSKLTYHAQHVAGPPSKWPSKPLEDVGFQAVLQMQGEMLVVQIRLNNEPLTGAKVRLFGEDGNENATAMTDERGKVTFSAEQIQPGLSGLLIGHLDKHRRGELNGEQYTSDMHYLTVTFRR